MTSKIISGAGPFIMQHAFEITVTLQGNLICSLSMAS
jgi:hypothetical protein